MKHQLISSLPTPGTERQPLLPLEFVPAVMRGHGLREAHSHPLVGMRGTGGEVRSRRAPAADAWREIDPYHLVEWGRTGTSYAALVLDCDSREAVERAHACAVGGGSLPTPNVTITRLASGHLHVGWMLARPVLRGEHAREKPLTALARVSEFYCAALDADRGYVGVLASNPLDVEHYATAWLRREPFSLAELAEVLLRRVAERHRCRGRGTDQIRAEIHGKGLGVQGDIWSPTSTGGLPETRIPEILPRGCSMTESGENKNTSRA